MSDLRLSVIYGFFARIVTLMNQVLSVPIIISLIGIHEFTEYNILTASVAWIITLGGCLFPSIVGDIARAKTDKKTELIIEKVSSSVITISVFCFFAFILYYMLIDSKKNEVSTVVALSLFILICSVSENIKQGLSENYKNSIYNGMGNVFSLMAIVFLSRANINVGLTGIIWATLGMIALWKFINFISILNFFSLKKINSKACIYLIKHAFSFVLISLAYYINTTGMITVLNYANYTSIVEFVVLQKILLIVMGIVVMIRNPLWSLIARMVHNGNAHALYKNYKKTIIIYSVLAPLLYLFVSLSLPLVVKEWTRGLIIDSFLSSSFALYLVIQIFVYINSIFYYGLEMFAKLSKILVLEAFINVCTVYLSAKNSIELSLIFLCLALISIFINCYVGLMIKSVCNNAKA